MILSLIPLIVLICIHVSAWEVSDARIPTQQRTSSGIPNRLIYTNKREKELSSWKELNPLLEIQYFDDERMNEFLSSNLRVLPAKIQDKVMDLPIIEKADLFRYVAIYTLGGIYADSDVEALSPLSAWTKEFKHDNLSLADLDFIFGIEFTSEQKDYKHVGHLPFQLTQFTFGAAKGSFIISDIIDAVADAILNVPQGSDALILQRTGPAIFSRAIIDTIAKYSPSPGVDDIGYPKALSEMTSLNTNGQFLTLNRDGTRIQGLILPYRAFAFHPFHNTGEKAVLTVHQYESSWRTE